MADFQAQTQNQPSMISTGISAEPQQPNQSPVSGQGGGGSSVTAPPAPPLGGTSTPPNGGQVSGTDYDKDSVPNPDYKPIDYDKGSVPNPDYAGPKPKSALAQATEEATGFNKIGGYGL